MWENTCSTPELPGPFGNIWAENYMVSTLLYIYALSRCQKKPPTLLCMHTKHNRFFFLPLQNRVLIITRLWEEGTLLDTFDLRY